MRKLILAGSAILVLLVAIGAAWLQRPVGWTPEQLATLQSLALSSLGPVPADPSNRVAGDPRAVQLGEKLFFDARLSGNGQVACATCHVPDRHFTDGRTLAQGVGILSRHTMTVLGSAYSPWLTWDGKADSLWAQALGPLESSVEQGGDRTFFAHQLAAHYRDEYEALFGPLPALDDAARFPAHAGPVGAQTNQDAWNAMAAADQDAINQVFANLGKAIAAYERTLQPGPSRFDRYVEAVANRQPPPGDAQLSQDELAGLRLFIGKAHCINCHNGPLFTNFEFHNTAVPGVPGFPLDGGRAAGVKLVENDPFNCAGKYSDAAPEACTALRFMVRSGPTLDGSFRTPTLRNVAETAPYMHAGQFATLQEAIQHYSDGGHALVGHNELAPLNLSDQEIRQIEAFLQTLTES